MASSALPPAIARDDSRDDDDTLYSGVRLRRDFGGVSHMWLRRRLAADPTFPRPVYIGSIPFWRLGGVRRWEASLPTAPPPTAIAAGERATEIAKTRGKEKPKAEPLDAPTPQRRPRRPRSPPEAAKGNEAGQ
jgi:hypothetical protein